MIKESSRKRAPKSFIVFSTCLTAHRNFVFLLFRGGTENAAFQNESSPFDTDEGTNTVLHAYNQP